MNQFQLNKIFAFLCNLSYTSKIELILPQYNYIENRFKERCILDRLKGKTKDKAMCELACV